MNIKGLFSKKEDKKEDVYLVTAKKAFESTKEPQLRRVIEKIDECRKLGMMKAYICEEELHQETIDVLLEKGYDLSMRRSNIMELGDNYYFNEVFWDKDASGKIR